MPDDSTLSTRVRDILALRPDRDRFFAGLESASPQELSAMMSSLWSTAASGEEQHALRDMAQAVLYRKLADDLTRKVTALDKSTRALTIVGWVLTVVVGLAGILVSVMLARHS